MAVKLVRRRGHSLVAAGAATVSAATGEISVHANGAVQAKAVAATAHSEWQPHPLMAIYRDHQIDVPMAILITTYVGAYVWPTSIFAQLAYPSYQIPEIKPGETALFDKGWLDALFVGHYVVLWTFLRAFCIEKILKPLARRLRVPKALQSRFGEQGWLVMYYTPSFMAGLYIIYHSPYWRNFKYFWIGYPHRHLTGSFKAYYLVQLAFWIQQLFVVHIEKPRKDYLQYVVHHFVTCALIISSYIANFTRIGNAVLVTMDVADIFLSSAKCFNYAKWKRTTDVLFVVFVAVWLYSRHYIYYRIVESIYVDLPDYLVYRWDPANGYYVANRSFYFFMTLFVSLQALLVFWLYLILRIMVRVIRGNNAADNRSDDEEEEISERCG